MKLQSFAVVVGSLLMSSVGLAADRSYVFLGGGLNFAGEEVVSSGPAGNMETDSGRGFVVNGGVGFSPMRNLRLEAELGYRSNPIDGVRLLPTTPPIAGIGVAGADGDIESLSVLVNAWYDIAGGEPWGFFLGGGIGAAQVSVKDYTLSTYPVVPSPPVTTALYADDEDWVFAYQVGAGASYKLNKSLAVDLSYRYFATDDASLSSVAGNPFKASVNDSRLLLSLRYAFE